MPDGVPTTAVAQVPDFDALGNRAVLIDEQGVVSVVCADQASPLAQEEPVAQCNLAKCSECFSSFVAASCLVEQGS